VDDCEFLLGGNMLFCSFHVQENQENETLTLEDVTLTQSVNIFGCKGTIIVIKGKVNAVNMCEYETLNHDRFLIILILQ
jgi:adenylyl cyclase-associated protein